MPKTSKNKISRVIPSKKIPHSVKTIEDLIQIGNSGILYENIDMNMLNRIVPYLCELQNLVGMDSLKETVFFQIIYYLQGLYRNGNEEYLHTMIMGSSGCGKCLAKNTPILMHDGTVKMVQDIKIGDILMGDDSTARNVLSVCNGYDKLYTVNQLYGESYSVNAEHVISLVLIRNWYKISESEKSHTIKWYDENGIHAKSIPNETVFVPFIKVGDVIDVPVKKYLEQNREWRDAFRGFKVAVEFQECHVTIDPYFVGFWIGDCTNENIKLKTSKEISIYFLRYIKNMRACIKYSLNDLLNNADINENREFQLFTHLRNYDLINVKRIPHCYRINSRDNRLKLLAGILDSGICVSTAKTGSVKIAIRWKELSDDIVFLCRSLGFVSDSENIVTDSLRKNYTKNECYYIVSISGNFNDVPIKQMQRVESNTSLNLQYDIDVVENGEGEYYGFEIDGNGRFLLEDFTVTHNTTVACILGKIYISLGILSENGQFYIAYRDDFIGEFIGSTAMKTHRLLESCLGGSQLLSNIL